MITTWAQSRSRLHTACNRERIQFKNTLQLCTAESSALTQLQSVSAALSRGSDAGIITDKMTCNFWSKSGCSRRTLKERLEGLRAFEQCVDLQLTVTVIVELSSDYFFWCCLASNVQNVHHSFQELKVTSSNCSFVQPRIQTPDSSVCHKPANPEI